MEPPSDVVVLQAKCPACSLPGPGVNAAHSQFSREPNAPLRTLLCVLDPRDQGRQAQTFGQVAAGEITGIRMLSRLSSDGKGSLVNPAEDRVLCGAA